ncbi:transposase [Streptomyces sp. KM273126]|nr:transposase [Streptomyces sp. KM273126]
MLRSTHPAHHFRSPLDLRAALMGMLHRLRTGIHWRDLPEKFGAPNKVRCRQGTWLTNGVWDDIVKLLNKEGKGTRVAGYEAAPTLVIHTDLDVGTLF